MFLQKYWEIEEIPFCLSQVSEKPMAMPMKGKPSSSSNSHSPPTAKWSRGSIHLGRAVCSEPSMQTVHRWETGQSTAPKAGRTFGIYCAALAASNTADWWGWLPDPAVQSCCRPMVHYVHSLEHASQVHLPFQLHTSRTHISFGWHAMHLRL